VVVRGKGLRELLLECEAKGAQVVVFVDSGDTSGEIVLADGEPYHATYAGKVGLAAFVALLDVGADTGAATLLRLSVPRTLSRYPRTLSLSLADLGVSAEERRFVSVFPSALVPAAESSSLSLEGIEPRDGAVRIPRRLMDASWAAWKKVGPGADALHAAYVFGARDETLHLGGERLGRALLRRVIGAVDVGRQGLLVSSVVDGMAASGGRARSNDYGCVIATREADANVSRSLAEHLMRELRLVLEAD